VLSIEARSFRIHLGSKLLIHRSIIDVAKIRLALDRLSPFSIRRSWHSAVVETSPFFASVINVDVLMA
jgi:hypothetical protein